jgi:redox-sensitive bicupin YhaK (pirin superfamily)
MNLINQSPYRDHRSQAAQDRGYADHRLAQAVSFSFISYYDPAHMGGGNRVISRPIEPGTGFSEHSHRNMEIISCVLAGELATRTASATSGSVGDVQHAAPVRAAHSGIQSRQARRPFLQSG